LYVLLPICAHAFALDFAQVGILRMAYSTAMAALQIPAGMLGEKVGQATLIAAIVASPPLTTVLLIPLGIALNGTSSVLYGIVAEFVHEDRQSRCFGQFYSLSSAAGAIAPLLFGVVSDAIGVAPALLLVALLALLTIPLALALHPHLRPDYFGSRA
jgi:MFS family permease